MGVGGCCSGGGRRDLGPDNSPSSDESKFILDRGTYTSLSLCGHQPPLNLSSSPSITTRNQNMVGEPKSVYILLSHSKRDSLAKCLLCQGNNSSSNNLHPDTPPIPPYLSSIYPFVMGGKTSFIVNPIFPEHLELKIICISTMVQRLLLPSINVNDELVAQFPSDL